MRMARNLKGQKDVFDVDHVGKPIKKITRIRVIQPSISAGALKQSSETGDSDDDFVVSIELDSAGDGDDDDEEPVPKSKRTKKPVKQAKLKQVKRPMKQTARQSKAAAPSRKPLRKPKSYRNDRIQQLFKSNSDIEPLPGRGDEFSWIKRTVSGLLESGLGGCLCKREGGRGVGIF